MGNLKELYYEELSKSGEVWLNYDQKNEREEFLKYNEFCRYEFIEFNNNFFKALIKERPTNKILYIQNSSHFLKSWPLKDIPHELTYDPHNKAINIEGNWDTVIGDTPWGYMKHGQDTGIQTIIESLKLISKNGIGIYYLPSFFHLKKNNFEKKINEQSFYTNSIIQMPNNSYEPITKLRGVLVFLSRKKTKQIYIAEFEELDPHIDQYDTVCEAIIGQFETDLKTGIPSDYEIISEENYIDDPNSIELEDDLWHGVRVDKDKFKGFENFKIERDIDRIISDYSGYQKYSLSDLGVVNRCKFDNKFIDINNSIYIPSIGKGRVEYDINSITLKHQNVFQVVLEEKKIINKYLVSFFNSYLGIMYLESQKYGLIPKISLKEIKNFLIPVPPIKEQNQIITTNNKINSAIASFEKIKENISINPISSKEELKKLESIVNAIGELSDNDHIKNLVREGESKTLEFKETFGLDVKTNKREKFLEEKCLKTIAAFLNSNGGNLLVGVDDSGKIKGINFELEKHHWPKDPNNKQKNDEKLLLAKDDFLKHFKNKMKSAIGEKNYLFYDSKILDIDGKLIFKVECRKAIDPVFINDKDFYVRTDPATDKLEGSQQHSYIKNRFMN